MWIVKRQRGWNINKQGVFTKSSGYFRWLLVGVLSVVCIQSKADDYEVMYQRLYDDYVSATPRPDSVIEDLIRTLQADGSWPDINYDSHAFVGGWRPMSHWDRLFHIALAYNRDRKSTRLNSST